MSANREPGGFEGVLLDPQAFVRLREWGGDELLHRMIELFLKNAPDKVGQVEAGLLASNLEEVERGSHSLKSSAGNLGAEALRLQSARVEGLAESEPAPDEELVRREVERLRHIYTETEAALKEARDRGKETP